MAGGSEEQPLIPVDTTAPLVPRWSVCDPRGTLHRYAVLIIMCTICVGSYFCFDNPAALQAHMLSDLDLSEAEYMAFYSWYQWPCIVMSVVGGYLIDRVLGNRMGIMLSAFLLAMSQAVFAVGGLVNTYWEMCLGRAMFGIVDGPLSIAGTNILVRWFKNKELCMVMGLRTSIARAFSVVNMNVMEPIYSYFNRYVEGHQALGITLSVGVIVCLISFLAAVAVSYFDRRADNVLQKPESKTSERGIRLRDVKDFQVTFWLLIFTTSVYYLAIFPFVGLGLVYFEMKYEETPQTADTINGLVYTMAAATMPIFGIVMDKTGRNLVWMFAGLTLSIASHVILAFTFVNPYLPTIMLGLGYSLTTVTVWPLVPFIVKEQHLGTAYGIMNSVVSIGQAVMNILAGHIVDTSGYLILEIVFTACMCGSLFLGGLLYLSDNLRGGNLNLTVSQRTKLSEIEKFSETKLAQNHHDLEQNMSTRTRILE